MVRLSAAESSETVNSGKLRRGSFMDLKASSTLGLRPSQLEQPLANKLAIVPARLPGQGRKATPVSGFRSSHDRAAIPCANFGIKRDTSKTIDLVWPWFRNPHDRVPARMM